MHPIITTMIDCRRPAFTFLCLLQLRPVGRCCRLRRQAVLQQTPRSGARASHPLALIFTHFASRRLPLSPPHKLAPLPPSPAVHPRHGRPGCRAVATHQPRDCDCNQRRRFPPKFQEHCSCLDWSHLGKPVQLHCGLTHRVPFRFFQRPNHIS